MFKYKKSHNSRLTFRKEIREERKREKQKKRATIIVVVLKKHSGKTILNILA